jgi:pyruvate dehydrogenase E2 component (dihydrolipoamide acetyltransferase)
MSATTTPRRFVSPLARRIAAELGIELAALAGSGPNGRIVRRDVERAHAAAPAAAAAPLTVPAAALAPNGERLQRAPLTRLQRTVARRMVEAKAGVPEFAVETRVDMEAAVVLRERLRELLPREALPSYNDMIVKACALALREHPRVNGRFTEDAFELVEDVNVGIAVAGDDALVVATIREADRSSLVEIAADTRRLAQQVREGAIAPNDLAGGTFTISNLGMFGVTRFEAIINPPQAAILAVGALRAEPVVRGEAVVPGHVLDLNLTCDHRILYGADGARFLASVRELLEAPLGLLL